MRLLAAYNSALLSACHPLDLTNPRLYPPPRSRAALPPRANAGNGRPDPRKQRAPRSGDAPDRVQRVSIAGPSDEDAAVAAALRRIDGRPDVRPVDPDEAARGRLDFAQVGSWSESAVRKAANAGAQGSAALDALPLQSFMPDKAAQDETRPFYEQVRTALIAPLLLCRC